MGCGHGATRRKAAMGAARRLERFVLDLDVSDEECDEYFCGDSNQYHDDVRRLIAEARLEIQRESVRERSEGVAKSVNALGLNPG